MALSTEPAAARLRVMKAASRKTKGTRARPKAKAGPGFPPSSVEPATKANRMNEYEMRVATVAIVMANHLRRGARETGSSVTTPPVPPTFWRRSSALDRAGSQATHEVPLQREEHHEGQNHRQEGT